MRATRSPETFLPLLNINRNSLLEILENKATGQSHLVLSTERQGTSNMEARLLQLHYRESGRDWELAIGSEEGIPLSRFPIPNTPDVFLLMGSKTNAMLAKMLGQGGPWEGWYVHHEMRPNLHWPDCSG